MDYIRRYDMNELYMERIKKKLEKIKEAVGSLEMLSPEQQMGAIGMIDDALDKLLLIDDGQQISKRLDFDIAKFNERNDELDKQLEQLDLKTREAYKEKLDWYKKAYNKLMEGAWKEPVDFKAIDEAIEKK